MDVIKCKIVYNVVQLDTIDSGNYSTTDVPMHGLVQGHFDYSCYNKARHGLLSHTLHAVVSV